MQPVDAIILGGGFSGSIMAMILRRLGRSAAVLERGVHPRFAIGESSTPLANLLLEELALRYDLPDLATFSKWGAWQAAHPEIACGLKRGFTFYKHTPGRAVDFADRRQQLLVAASPNDRIADTHWYRPQFDQHLASQAAALGAHVFEKANFRLENTASGWRALGTSSRGEIDLEARFIVDATGPRGCLWKHLALGEATEGFLADGFPRTQALFAHFTNVARLDPPSKGAPYPADDAALHHIFEGGWIWVLRFNNSVASAGVVAQPALADELRLAEKAPAWNRLLDRFPTIRAQFAHAQTATPFYYQPMAPFRAPKAAGPNWALLPSAAGFVDPLFSTGFVLTLLGIERLARQFAVNQESDLAEYEAATFRELDQAGTLARAAYRSFGDFEKFIEISRFYFASAIWSETLRRLGRTPPNFLFSNRPAFLEAVRNLAAGERLTVDLKRYDLAGLTDAARQNWHPALASDLRANASKIPATALEIEAMLKRCGF